MKGNRRLGFDVQIPSLAVKILQRYSVFVQLLLTKIHRKNQKFLRPRFDNFNQLIIRKGPIALKSHPLNLRPRSFVNRKNHLPDKQPAFIQRHPGLRVSLFAVKLLQLVHTGFDQKLVQIISLFDSKFVKQTRIADFFIALQNNRTDQIFFHNHISKNHFSVDNFCVVISRINPLHGRQPFDIFGGLLSPKHLSRSRPNCRKNLGPRQRHRAGCLHRPNHKSLRLILRLRRANQQPARRQYPSENPRDSHSATSCPFFSWSVLKTAAH